MVQHVPSDSQPTDPLMKAIPTQKFLASRTQLTVIFKPIECDKGNESHALNILKENSDERRLLPLDEDLGRRNTPLGLKGESYMSSNDNRLTIMKNRMAPTMTIHKDSKVG